MDFERLMLCGSFNWKDTIGISRIAIPGLIARPTILILIVLLATCKHDGRESSNSTSPYFTNSPNVDLAGLPFHRSLEQPLSADLFNFTTIVAHLFTSVQGIPVTVDKNAAVPVNGVVT